MLLFKFIGMKFKNKAIDESILFEKKKLIETNKITFIQQYKNADLIYYENMSSIMYCDAEIDSYTVYYQLLIHCFQIA